MPGLHKRAITLLSGKTSTRKIVKIDTLTEPEVHAKLDANHH